MGLVAGTSMIFGANAAIAGDWQPQKPITMVIMAGQGRTFVSVNHSERKSS